MAYDENYYFLIICVQSRADLVRFYILFIQGDAINMTKPPHEIPNMEKKRSSRDQKWFVSEPYDSESVAK